MMWRNSNEKEDESHKKKPKIKLVKNHFSGHVTEHSSETCVKAIEGALQSFSPDFIQEGYKFIVREEKYGDKLKLEIQVCEVHQHNEKGENVIKYGISFRRAAGSVFHYKEAVDNITAKMADVLK